MKNFGIKKIFWEFKSQIIHILFLFLFFFSLKQLSSNGHRIVEGYSYTGLLYHSARIILQLQLVIRGENMEVDRFKNHLAQGSFLLVEKLRP